MPHLEIMYQNPIQGKAVPDMVKRIPHVDEIRDISEEGGLAVIQRLSPVPGAPRVTPTWETRERIIARLSQVTSDNPVARMSEEDLDAAHAAWVAAGGTDAG